MATTPKAKTAKPADGKPDEATSAAPPYLEQAAELGVGTRTLAEEMRDRLAEFSDRIGTLQQTAPGLGADAAADGVNRLPMAINAVHTALDGLVHVAADLAVKAQQTGT